MTQDQNPEFEAAHARHVFQSVAELQEWIDSLLLSDFQDMQQREIATNTKEA